jgi:uncharacterized membrane protein YphA (DoxX/SURF4 family)
METKPLNYWLYSGLMSAFMLFSAFYAETHQQEFTARLGFPAYFRVELTIAKIIGAVLLMIPQVPQRIREWVYVGFCICLISAVIAKSNSGYEFLEAAQPAFSFIFYLLLIYFLHRSLKTT